MKTNPGFPKRWANGNQILMLAQQKGLTQNDLVRKTGYKLTTIGKAYRSKQVTVRVLEAIAEVLEVPLDAICDCEAERELNDDSGKADEKGEIDNAKLRQLAAEILANSPATRSLIVAHNEFLKDANGSDVADSIFDSEMPIEVLFNCIERDIDSVNGKDICESMSLLVGILAPICLTIDEFSELQTYLGEDNGEHFVKIPTSDSLVARASVGYVKGLPIESRELNEFNKFLDRRDKVGSVPPPPEFGAQYDKTKSETDRTIVDSFRILLARFLGSPDELGRVKAALRNTAKLNVHFCVLFPNKLTLGQFKAVKEAFPELILLLSQATEEKESHYDALDQIKRVLEFFNAE